MTPLSDIRQCLKAHAHRGLRAVHESFFKRELPTKLGVYLHDLGPQDYPGFRDMVEHLQSMGYQFVTPDRFLSGSDEKCVYLSFDDNYRSWYDALPLLSSLNVVATFFTNTCCFRDFAATSDIAAYFNRLQYDGDRTSLSTSELTEISESGHVVGAHTHSHFDLGTLSFSDAQSEILRSKTELERLLGKPVQHFSYPFGMRRHFTEPLRQWCLDNGFTTVSNAIPGLQHATQHASGLNRSLWDLSMPLEYNLTNLQVDARLFAAATGRSAMG